MGKLANRIEMIKHFNLYFQDQSEIKAAEIGVFRGRFSEIMFKEIPNLHLICVDNWKNIPHHNSVAREARSFLAGFNTQVMQMHSMDAAKEVEDESLDFVYIDANHRYHAARDDIAEWAKKVRIGGIVSGDDYYHSPSGLLGVVEAVDEYCKVYNYKLNLTDWDFKNVTRDDRQPNFWFVKTHKAVR